MRDPETFERRLADAFSRYADLAPTEVERSFVAQAIAAGRRGPLAGIRLPAPSRALIGWAVLALLVLGAVAATLFTGTRRELVPPHWTTTGSMSQPRQLFGLVLLADGTVLAAGGPASAERFDPRRGVWDAAGTMSAARGAPTMTGLSDGRVLVAGGATGNDNHRLASAELYDPKTGAWTVTAPMLEAEPRRRPCCSRTATSSSSAAVRAASRRLRPTTLRRGTWTATGPMTQWRASASAAVLDDGRVLVAGRLVGAGGGTVGSAEVYDPTARSWSATRPMAAGRADGQTTTRLPDGRVLVAGGVGDQSVPGEIYDPKTNAWSTAAPGLESIGGQTATSLPDGTVLFAGGWDGVHALATSEVYDPVLNTWASVAPIRNARVSAAAVPLADGRVLIAGGGSNVASDPGLRSTELYDPGGTR